MPSLLECLRSPKRMVRDRAICALKSCYCWPDDAADDDPAFEGVGCPDALNPGDALLASVRNHRGELWQLWNAKHALDAAIDVQFSAATHKSWDGLHGAIVQAMPLLATVPQSGGGWERGARPVKIASVAPAILDGESFGLALALSRVSEWLELDPPADFIALAALDSRGRTGAVDGLEAKCECVRGWALGVHRILVTPEQQEQARQCSGEVVIPVTTLEEAVAVIYPDAREVLRARWSADRAGAVRTLDAMHRQALNTHVALSSWRALATSSEVLADLFRDDDPDRHGRALFTHLIARRHDNINDDPTAMIPFLNRAQHRSVRLKSWAQVLQSVADCCSPALSESDVEGLVAEALGDARPPAERAEEDLVLLGAAGRCLAAIAPERACDMSREACEGWSALDKADQNSRALSEWLRLAGLLGRTAEVSVAVNEHLTAQAQHPTRDSVSVAFARLAAGGAYVKIGQPKLALKQLDAADGAWRDAPPHVSFQRSRWRARAWDALGNDQQAANERAKLETHVAELLDAPNSAQPAVLRLNLALAQLDHALHTGEDTTASLAVIEGLPAESRWMARLRRHCPAGVSEERWIADAMPY